MVGDQLQHCFSLLESIERSQESKFDFLLEESHRELVADAVNAAILSTNPNVQDEKICMQSSLERIIRQLTALNGVLGETLDLQRILENRKE